VRAALELPLHGRQTVGGQALDGALPIAAVDLDHPGRAESVSNQWQGEKLGLGHHAHATAEHVIEDRHIVVRLVVAHHHVRRTARALGVAASERRLRAGEVIAPPDAHRDLRVPHHMGGKALETIITSALRQPAADRVEDRGSGGGESLVGIPEREHERLARGRQRAMQVAIVRRLSNRRFFAFCVGRLKAAASVRTIAQPLCDLLAFLNDPGTLRGSGLPTMTANTIRTALGVLQDEPDNDQAWTDLREALGFTADQASVDSGELSPEELGQLLAAARQAHEMRREYEAVADLLEIEAALAKRISPEREAELVAALANIEDDILHDDVGAVASYRRLLALRPGDPTAQEAIERAEAKRVKWKDLAQRYFTESKSAGDASFKSSLLVSAAEIGYRYGRPELDARAKNAAQAAAKDEAPKSLRGSKKSKKQKAAGKDPETARREFFDKIIGLLRDALALDPKNRRAVLLQERLLRDEERWEELATALETFATESNAKDEKIAALMRLSRVLRKKLEARERAVSVFERVLDLSPGHPEATSALVNHFTDASMWDHLVSLYEGQLSGGGVRQGQEVGVILQVAMINWRMRDKPEAAEPYFERLRKLEPAHVGMLGFFREWCPKRSEQARLAQILSDAQRAMPEGPERGKLAAEIAGLAEEGANAQKAIEQWRTLLRSEPANVTARDALKRLYGSTGQFNHLADLLRSELERIAPDDAAARLPVLRDIAAIYREHIRSDSALVTVLSQIIGLDPHDAAAVRELARVYEALGRWRDLLTTQLRLAELETVPSTKAELYRAIARRWLEQFSNVQNALEAYEKLRESEPDDREALAKLKELYTKRRAYRQLFDILEVESRQASGPARRALWMEMAKMASERLDRGEAAARLYKLVLGEDPKDAVALDALEKQAERDKDFVTVADALERRADLTEDPAARLVVLQKLGTVFADRLQDHVGALRIWRRVLELAPGTRRRCVSCVTATSPWATSTALTTSMHSRTTGRASWRCSRAPRIAPPTSRSRSSSPSARRAFTRTS